MKRIFILALTLVSLGGLDAHAKCMKEARQAALKLIKTTYPEAKNTAKVVFYRACYDDTNRIVAEVELKKLPSNAHYTEHRANSKYVIVGYDKSNCTIQSSNKYDWQEGIGYLLAYGDCYGIEGN